MESVAKIKGVAGLALAVPALFFLALSCQGSPPAEPIVLQEIAPIPRAVLAAQQAVVEYEPVYSTFRIIEVSEVNGVQRFFLARIGTDRTIVKVGVTGDIGEDAEFQRIIGNYKIIELYGDFFRCEIVELTHRIGTNTLARIQTGEVIKGTTTPR
jgi:hypothetical protein